MTLRINNEKLIMKNKARSFALLLMPYALCLLSGCGVYSFTAGSIPPNVRTISILNFHNESGGGPPNLTQVFTEKLRGYYQQNSRLIIVRDQGDWQLDGRIVSYHLTPIAPQGNETSGLNRLTIGVRANFINTKDEKASFENTFSFYADFRQELSLSQVEGQLIEEITDQLVFDIFTRTTSTW